MKKYVLALDQGTTSSRAVLFDRKQNIIHISQQEFPQYYPRDGWVEQDPMEIYSSQWAVLNQLMAECSVTADEIIAVGITNQRETTIIWDKETGRPIYNAIVWQCRRTAEIVKKLVSNKENDKYIREATGLVPDAYFSSTKIRWILDNVPQASEKAKRGELLFGTVDSWLVWKLTGGKVHITDHTNASRTMLYNIHTLDWDDKLLEMLDIPKNILPDVKSSSEIYGEVSIDGIKVPIAGIAGDQQAALFGQTCFDEGSAKNTYGTGCFLLQNTGEKPKKSKNGLLTTIGMSYNNKILYALEGSVFVAGAAVQWLRDDMRFITESCDVEYYAGKVDDTGGVYMVPAFTGLGAPHWDMFARGTIIGITRATKREHVIRAAEESIAYQTADLIHAIEKDTGIQLTELNVDGGASRDNFLLQFQADILDMSVIRPKIRETTALGAAYLAGLATGFWNSTDELKEMRVSDKIFEPDMDKAKRTKLIKGWNKAVNRSLNWAEPDSE